MSITLGTDKTRRTLPVADGAQVRRESVALLRGHRRELSQVLGWHAAASLAALATPWLIGRLVNIVTGSGGHRPTTDGVDQAVLLVALAVVTQTVLTWAARRSAFITGETLFAELRENFVRQAVRLPLSTVERAGTGDLVARTTNDVEALAHVARFGLPALVIGFVATFLTAAMAIITAPLAAPPILLAALVLWPTTRRYLKVAVPGYLWERASYAELNGVVGETSEGARTVEALGLQEQRRRRFVDVLTDCLDAERYTLRIRLWYFPAAEFGYTLPIAATLAWSGWLAITGHLTIGAATAATLYVHRLGDPLDEIMSWLDEVQIAASSLARILGVGNVPPDRVETGATPDHDQIAADDVTYAYRSGHDVLHGVSLAVRPGERLAIVGPSGAGKSTLGRLMAGIDAPRTGRITVGDVPLVDLPLDRLRGEVALVTQEHHVFVGTLAENLRLARSAASDEDLLAALSAVDATSWAVALPQGLETVVGSGGHVLSEPQAQQLALARLVLADPHTLVLDEATSLLDPRAARHLERSLAAVVEGRTVVAIAHRLHTAHDADRVCVVEDGMVSELGSHAELLEQDGAYAALWHTWTADSPVVHP